MTRFIIEDMNEMLMGDLASLAAENGLEVDVQARELLRQYVPVRDRAKLIARLDAIAAQTPKDVVHINSVIMLREDRQR